MGKLRARIGRDLVRNRDWLDDCGIRCHRLGCAYESASWRSTLREILRSYGCLASSQGAHGATGFKKHMPTSHDEAIHDLSNLQSVIMSNAEFVIRRALPGSHNELNARTIYKACASMAGPLKILLSENIRFIPKIQPLSLNLVLNGQIASLRAEIGNEAQINLEMEPNLPLIDGDQFMLEDLFRQLAINATTAMRDTVGPRVITIKTWAENRKRVIAQIVDNGIGIDPKHVRKILRGKIFTTKEGGTGHGFENIRRMLAALNGRMEIESTKAGTAFTFNFNALPRAA
jgi:signal transduction histidine kinase